MPRMHAVTYWKGHPLDALETTVTFVLAAIVMVVLYVRLLLK